MNILNKEFKYTNAAATDLRKTFARVRKELAAKQAAAIPSDDSKRKTLRAVGGKQ